MNRFLRGNMFWLILVLAELFALVFFTRNNNVHSPVLDNLYAHSMPKVLRTPVAVHFPAVDSFRSGDRLDNAIHVLAREAHCMLIIDGYDTVPKTAVSAPVPVPLLQALNLINPPPPGDSGFAETMDWGDPDVLVVGPPPDFYPQPVVTIVYSFADIVEDGIEEDHSKKMDQLAQRLRQGFAKRSYNATVQAGSDGLIVTADIEHQKLIPQILGIEGPNPINAGDAEP